MCSMKRSGAAPCQCSSSGGQLTVSYGRDMDNRDEVREFLTSRRAKISPERAGLPAGSRRRRGKEQWKPHRSLQWTLDAITAGPAFVRNGLMDILATNQLARAFYRDLYAAPGEAGESLAVPVPRPRVAALLPRLGPVRRHRRRHPAHRGRPQSVRRGSARSRR
ncbi:MmyB family transcriptional regulator [Streptomyces massasporeus]|uniref:MmyB family transcriptional regulator n=1 Tax=Streptomyces massasporeus TaxID=67324 RepID=UPI0036FCEDAA